MTCTQKEKDVLLELDSKFREVEDDIRASQVKFQAIFEKELKDIKSQNLGVYDYELETEVGFYAQNLDDPLYEIRLSKNEFEH
ncbi:MAG: hypothetical protein GX282_00865 [Campylobacteraceae bacterium]|nr:hypothetical protein [Campylobacteraceae bacterium]